MQKIPTIFERDRANMKRVLDRVVPGCEWVLAGEGTATEKFDGSACLVRNGFLFKRHELAAEKGELAGWIHWTFDPEQKSGHGWLPVREGPEDLYHREAWSLGHDGEGTYELVGPRINRNPHEQPHHKLWLHGSNVLVGLPRALTFESIGEWLATARPMEGVVWHHPDGRMAKIKRRDFGLAWPAKAVPA